MGVCRWLGSDASGRTARRVRGVLVLFLLAVAGCAENPRLDVLKPPIYPPPPAQPRYIFERTLKFSSDVEAFGTGARLKLFATGESRKIEALVKPYGIAVYHGRVYVTDTVDHDVMVFDIPAKHFFQFGATEPGQLQQPHGIAVSPDGKRVYVCDTMLKRILVYDAEGKYLTSIGDKSIFKLPTGVAISPDGSRIYAVDDGGIHNDDHHVLVFDSATGKLIQTIGKRGTKPGEFNLPLLDAVAPDGTLYVVDGGNFRVEAFTPDGKFKFAFGKVGRLPGQFARPKGIAVDPQGNIYVVDTAFGNFQIFNPKGQLLMFIGNRGEAGLPGKYMLPAGIAVDHDGRIYIVDQFFRKVDIFRPVTLGRLQGYAGVLAPDEPPPKDNPPKAY